MTTSKMTYVDALNAVLTADFPMDEAVREKLTALRDQQIKKRNSTSTNGKPTAAQERNKKVQELIVAVLAMASEPMTVSEIQHTSADLGEYSNQLIANATNKLVSAGKVCREEIKGHAKFSLIASEVDAD